MNYQTATDTWVYGLLTGSADLVSKATGGIFNKRPDAGVAPPYVIVSTVKDQPSYVNGNYWVMSRLGIKIQAVALDVAPTDKTYVDTMSDDIDAVMGAGKPLVGVQNSFIFSVKRMGSVDIAPWDNQRPSRYRGYQYEIIVRAVPS